MKIFLLSYAGGSSLSYISWKPYFVNSVPETLDYKGHGLRQNEKPDNSVEEMAVDIADQIARISENERFAIFGHSMGGLVAWHAAWVLLSKYRMKPERLCLSACPSPMDFSIKLPQNSDEILDRLVDSAHIRPDIMESDYFRKKIFPIIKHDYAVVSQQKRSEIIKRISIPLYVFFGLQDELVEEKAIRKWEQFTSKECKFFPFEGTHFYFNDLECKKYLCSILDGTMYVSN